MRTCAIEMPSGVAGDMLLAALLDAGGDLPQLQRDLDALGVGPLPITEQEVLVGSLRARRVDVAVPQTALWQQEGHSAQSHDHHHHHEHSHDHHHHHEHDHDHDEHHQHAPGTVHRPYAEIRDLLQRAPLAERVRERAQRVFRLLAEAEATAHGVAPEAVLFHEVGGLDDEVGGLDAIADVVGVCLLLEQLAIDHQRVNKGDIHHLDTAPSSLLFFHAPTP